MHTSTFVAEILDIWFIFGQSLQMTFMYYFYNMPQKLILCTKLEMNKNDIYIQFLKLHTLAKQCIYHSRTSFFIIMQHISFGVISMNGMDVYIFVFLSVYFKSSNVKGLFIG